MLEAIVIVLTLAADQITKILSVKLLPALPGGTYPLWENVFHFTCVENRGAAFGMLQGQMWLFYAITALACALIFYCLIHFHKRLHPLMRACLALIAAGALGNLIDRAFLGYVRDMLDFRLINFAVFNVADSAVCVGAVLLALDILFFRKGKALAAEIDRYFDKKKERRKGKKTEGAEAAEQARPVPERKEEDRVDS